MFKPNQKYSLDTIAPTVLGIRLLPRGYTFINMECIASEVSYEMALLIRPDITEINDAVYELRHDLMYKKASQQTYVIFKLADTKLVLALDWIDMSTVSSDDTPIQITMTWSMSNEDDVKEIVEFISMLGYEPNVEIART